MYLIHIFLWLWVLMNIIRFAMLVSGLAHGYAFGVSHDVTCYLVCSAIFGICKTVQVSIMAEGMTREGKTLEQMEKEITCAVCQEHYTEPKVFPCLHYYCKECVLKLSLRTASNKPFSCPECRTDTILPEGGVEELKTAFFVNRYKSNYYALERVHGKVEVKCEGCPDSKDRAEAFCRQCAAFICKECVKLHKKLTAFSSHEVDSLEELKRGRIREVCVKEPPMKCLTHEEPLIIYCFDCNSLICRDCTVKIHRDHNFEFSKVAAPQTKEVLQRKATALGGMCSSLLRDVEEIQTTKQEIEAQGVSVADTINTSFNQLQHILEERKQQLLEESARKVREKTDKLSERERGVIGVHDKVECIVDYAEKLLEHSSDNEVMSMHTEIEKELDQEIQAQSQLGKSREPLEEVDMGVEIQCCEALHQLCQTNAKICQIAIDPAQCTVRVEGADCATIQQTATVTLTTKLTNGRTTGRRASVTSQLKSLCAGSVIECEVELSGLGEYRIQYTPTVRGRHQLAVLVNDEHVAGSPFPVSVSIHPTQLAQPVQVWTGINWPTSIAINSTGEVIVSELGGGILKIDKKGTKRILASSVCKLNHVWSIATDNEDSIYCAGARTNQILKCSRNGDNIRVCGVEQVKDRGLLCVAVDGDKVLVCESENSGAIMVYDRNMKYKRRIEHGNGRMKGVACTDNAIYAINSDKQEIEVFSKDGVFLKSFDCLSNGVKMLNDPQSIAVSGPFIYISNWDSRNVSVFTTEGDYVTSIGSLGEKKGQFKRPFGVCLDSDHFLYVTDSLNDRVQCF